MFNPGVRFDLQKFRLEYFDTSTYLRYKTAFTVLKELKNHIQIQLTTACESYVQSYGNGFIDHQFMLHPMVTNNWGVVESINKRITKNVLLFVGSAKEDKGLQFTLDIAKGLFKTHGYKYILHYNRDFYGAEKYNKQVQALVNNGQIEIIEGHISQEKYKELILTADFVCILHDPKEYHFKTSGILWDSIKNRDCKFIVTKNTWVFDELNSIKLPFTAVEFGNVEMATKLIGNLDSQVFKNVEDKPDSAYLDQINQDYPSWVINKICQASRTLATFSTRSLPAPTSGKNILLIKTKFGHFTENSGPTGFVPFLRVSGYTVDIVEIELGEDKIDPTILRNSLPLTNLGKKYVQSYQSDSVRKELEINQIINCYDFVHFIDGEHCGVLTALLKVPGASNVKFIITFHQPVSYLKNLIWDQRYLKHFDVVHLMAPDQKSFFQGLDDEKFIALPHGLAPSHIESKGIQILVGDEQNTFEQLRKNVRNKKIILTVGNWLRDYEMLKKVARRLKDESAFVFIVISKGLILDLEGLNNVVLFNNGVSDAFLNNVYSIADLMFLPLHDSAANNAVLESIGRGLQILSTDLESIRFYTNNQALYAKHDEELFTNQIKSYFLSLNDAELSITSNNLKLFAKSLSWENISQRMAFEIYQ